MARHPVATDELRERASLYELGLLEPEELTEFESHLVDCEVCAQESRAFRETTALLAYTAPESQPSPRVRKELLRLTTPPQVVVRAGDGGWRATPFPGVEVKRLFVDAASGTVTSLVRMSAGSTYPRHRHAAPEHSYVLEGDVIMSDHILGPGDYEVNAADTDHAPMTTRAGCLVLVIHNQADQVYM